MFHYYLKALNKTFTLGRSRRKEYWYFWLVNILITFAGVCAVVIWPNSLKLVDRLLNIYNFVLFIPNTTLCIRRLHDIGKSGWFMLFPCVVILGLIALVSLFKLKGLSIVFMVFLATVVVIYFCLLFVRNGDDGPNQYGPDPKHED
jgi:uncharacterized membrane protein YhaH (DUF805 family)